MKTSDLIRLFVLLLIMALSTVAISYLGNNDVLAGTGLKNNLQVIQFGLIFVSLLALFGLLRGGLILLGIGLLATPLFIAVASIVYPPGVIGVIIVVPFSIVVALVAMIFMAIGVARYRALGQMVEGQSTFTKKDFFSALAYSAVLSVAYIGIALSSMSL